MNKDELLLVLMATGLAGLVTFGICGIAIRLKLTLDPVSHRSSHTVATSRLGGVAIMLGFGIGCIWGFLGGIMPRNLVPAVLFICAQAGMVVGLADDLSALRVRTKLIGQLVVALAISSVLGGIPVLPLPGLAFQGLAPEMGVFAIPLGALWIVAFVNAFNFMDGVDGLASGTATIALMLLATVASLASGGEAGVFFIILTGAVLGFFIQNYGRGRIFLGDSGSHALGFVIGACALDLPQQKLFSPRPEDAGMAILTLQGGAILLVIALLFLPHILDVTYTLAMRVFRRDLIFMAHRDHLYQRLHQTGWTHRQVADSYIAFTALGGIFALMGVLWGPAFMWAGGGILSAGYFVFMTKQLRVPDKK